MSCYPLYLSIGNLPKKIRCTYSQHAYILVGYFPSLDVTGMEGDKAAFTEAKKVLYHECFRMILKDLDHATRMYVYLEFVKPPQIVELSLTVYFDYRGYLWKSADGQTRKCYPVVAAFQVDYPESQLLTLTRKNNACPTCMAGKSDFGDLSKRHEMRTPDLASNLYQQAKDLEVSRSVKDADDFLQKYGQVYLEVCYSKSQFSFPNSALNINHKDLFLCRTSSGTSRDAIFMRPLCLICFIR